MTEAQLIPVRKMLADAAAYNYPGETQDFYFEQAQNILKKYTNPNYLLQNGPNRGETPLSLAIINHNTKMVDLLLEWGANPNYVLTEGVNQGMTFLGIALIYNAGDLIIDRLLKANANTNIEITRKSHHHMLPLTFAIKHNDKVMVEKLL